jgi:hypothetical protein
LPPSKARESEKEGDGGIMSDAYSQRNRLASALGFALWDWQRQAGMVRSRAS